MPGLLPTIVLMLILKVGYILETDLSRCWYFTILPYMKLQI